MTSYIIRLDDLTKCSDFSRWESIISCCRTNNVQALLATVPKCSDKKLNKGVENTDVEFWKFVVGCKDMDVALHGLNHERMGNMEADEQLRILTASMKEFLKHSIIPDVFVPPGHSFNDATFYAMKFLDITYFSDGVGLYPWKKMDTDVIQVPQIFWKPRKFPFGVITLCLHPDTMSWDEIKKLNEFICENNRSIMSITDVNLNLLELINIPFKPLYKYVFKRKFGKTIPF